MARHHQAGRQTFLHSSRFLYLAGDSEAPREPLRSELCARADWAASPSATATKAICPAGSGQDTAGFGGDPDGRDLEGLRLQVLGIIASVLEDPAPEFAGVQSRLRECLARNAGYPEKALLEHLRSLHGSELAGSKPYGLEPYGPELQDTGLHGQPAQD